MKPNRFLRVLLVVSVILTMLAASLLPHQTVQAAGVVGTGTLGSCTEAALDALRELDHAHGSGASNPPINLNPIAPTEK